MNLLPQDDKFFRFIQEQLSITCRASTLLADSLSPGYSGDLGNSPGTLKKLEREGDSVVRETIRHLQRTFLTPFEPEVVLALTKKLDAVLDAIEETVFRIVTYSLEPIPNEIAQIARIARESCRCLLNGFQLLKSGKPAAAELRKVHALGSQARGLSRRFLSQLFRIQREPVYILKRKEAAESLASITEWCSGVALSSKRFPGNEAGIYGLCGGFAKSVPQKSEWKKRIWR